MKDSKVGNVAGWLRFGFLGLCPDEHGREVCGTADLSVALHTVHAGVPATLPCSAEAGWD